MKKILIFCFVIGSIGAHPVHISTTDIVYNAAKSSLEISIKVFIDDLESIIRNRTGEQIRIDSQQKLSDNREFLEHYVRMHFKIWIEDSLQSYVYIGQEQEYEFLWIYLECSAIEPHQSFKLQQSILTDLISDQNNYVHFYSPEQQTFIFSQQYSCRLIKW